MRPARRRCTALLALSLVALLCGAAAASARAPQANPPAQSSVIGGADASIADYPWLAYIQGEEGIGSGLHFYCTGTVVAPRVVLTAGHCVENLEAEVLYDARGFRVATGVANRRHVPPDHISTVSQALIYPGFRPAHVHGDAGLLILSQPVAAPALPMASAADGALLAAGTPVHVAGWGLADPAAQESPGLLQATEMTIQASSRCRRGHTDFHHKFSPALQLCTLSPPHFRSGGCFGDSGGPAIAQRPDGSPVEVGIVSGGGNECELTEPNVFTRVDLVSQWASEWIAAVETGAPAPALKVLPAPRMSLLEARFLALRGLAEDFAPRVVRHQPRFEETVRVRCARADRSSFRCRVGWQRHGDDYYGAITVSYSSHSGVLVWNDSYTIDQVDSACHHPVPGQVGSCAIQTRTRNGGAPKHLPSF